MDETSKKIFQHVGIEFENINELDGMFIPREQVISTVKYEEVKKLVIDLKSVFSSSNMTCLQKPAGKEQKWPLLNLVRQILGRYSFDMEPVRKSDGYTPEGIKKYKRFFNIKKRHLPENTHTKNLDLEQDAV
jgi:hypothetical protein